MLFDFFAFGDVLISEDCVDGGGGESRGCSAGATETYVLLRHVRLYVLSGCDIAVRRHCVGILVDIELSRTFRLSRKGR